MTSPRDRPGSSIVEELRADIARFAESVDNLTGNVVDSVAEQARANRRTRHITVGLAASLVLDLVLTAMFAVVSVRVSDVQRVTSDDVLCPLYGLIVSGYHPELRPAGPARDEYVADYLIIRKGYLALNCAPQATPSPVGPRPSPSPSES